MMNPSTRRHSGRKRELVPTDVLKGKQYGITGSGVLWRQVTLRLAHLWVACLVTLTRKYYCFTVATWVTIMSQLCLSRTLIKQTWSPEVCLFPHMLMQFFLLQFLLKLCQNLPARQLGSRYSSDMKFLWSLCNSPISYALLWNVCGIWSQ